MTRRRFAAALLLAAVLPPWRARASGRAIEVWTGPGCSCCHEWVKHLQANGFEVKVHEGGNSEARARLGMPVKFGSCHSGEVDGYALEGHVPAPDIQRMLKERPDGIGLSVPAMPRGSPGMDGPAYGNARDPYDVLLVLRDGTVRVYRFVPMRARRAGSSEVRISRDHAQAD